LVVDESKYEKNLGTGGVFTGAAAPSSGAQGGAPGDWKLEIWRLGLGGITEAIDAAAVKDLLLVCHYTAKAAGG
jgi:hypothetical protein